MPNGRCRLHGGRSPGAPKGNKNAFKHGRYFPLCVQLTKLWPLLVVAITVCELPSANVPPPLTVPSAEGVALAERVYCFGLTVSVATRAVFPWLLLVLS
jgi:hypothetical protein